jgi:hypothetical protein
MRWVLLGFALLIGLGIVGWRSARGREFAPGFVSVEGRLLVDDKPAAHAAVALHPIGTNAAAVIRPVAMTQADGSFRLTTHFQNDGAPAGEYTVTLFWPDPKAPIDECECKDPAEHDQLCGLYLNAEKSPLRATLRSGDKQLTINAAPASERLKFEMQMRRLGKGSVLDSFLENRDERTDAQNPMKGK